MFLFLKTRCENAKYLKPQDPILATFLDHLEEALERSKIIWSEPSQLAVGYKGNETLDQFLVKLIPVYPDLQFYIDLLALENMCIGFQMALVHLHFLNQKDTRCAGIVLDGLSDWCAKHLHYIVIPPASCYVNVLWHLQLMIDRHPVIGKPWDLKIQPQPKPTIVSAWCLDCELNFYCFDNHSKDYPDHTLECNLCHQECEGRSNVLEHSCFYPPGSLSPDLRSNK